MKLISFDIGIKNMAYCIFSTDQNTLIVQDWGILNLLEKEEIAQKCSCELKSSKNPCSRKAKYVKNEMFFCETHAKKVIKDNELYPATFTGPGDPHSKKAYLIKKDLIKKDAISVRSVA